MIMRDHSEGQGKDVAMERLVDARNAFYSTFSVEINHLRAFMKEYPFLTLSLPFFLGLIVGGVLRATVSQFVIASLVGGFGFATLYGLSIGLPVVLSILLVVPVLLFSSYATVRILWAIESHSRVAPYLTKLKNRYGPGARFFAVHAGKIGVGGALALCTFLFGWWVAVVISYLLDVAVKTTMKATTVGLLIGSAVSWASYEGLASWLPNPLVVTAILMIVFSAVARVLETMAKREAAKSEPRPKP
jgi:hypothetical protein